MDGRQKSPLRHVKRAGIKVILVPESSALFDVRVLMVVVFSDYHERIPLTEWRILPVWSHEGC